MTREEAFEQIITMAVRIDWEFGGIDSEFEASKKCFEILTALGYDGKYKSAEELLAEFKL